MTTAELHEHLNALRQAGTDLTHVEVKLAAAELPKRLWETVSAFSNTPQGGVLILGVSEESGFSIVGISHAGKIQQDLASLCSIMEPAVRAHIELHRIEGKNIITAEIPELPAAIKPCFHPGSGLTNGAFIRVADGDRKLSSYEVQMMLSARGQPKDDEEPVPKTTLKDLQARLVKGLLSRLRRRPGTRLRGLSDEALLRHLRVLVPLRNRLVCSLGGILALGKYPQQYFPALSLTFVVYPGNDVGEPGPGQVRFLDNARIEGAIPSMLQPTLAVLQRNAKQASAVRGIYREDLEEYPATALREAIVNALAHRDLSTPSRGTPVQVQMFQNRLVVVNPGGLYGPITVDLLGREGISSARNQTLLRLLEDVTPAGEKQAICENRGSGVGAMLAALRGAGLPRALFDNRIASFRVTFLNGPRAAPDLTRIRQRADRRDEILRVLRGQAGLSRSEIGQRLALTDAATRRWLSILRDEGLVVTTDTKARSRNVRYRLAPLARNSHEREIADS
jgi:ATP-dependent DNA helicase RecG